MILQNKRDTESWVRERTINSMKENEFLLENDIVKVAEDGNFYLITSEQTDMPLLKEGLYAKVKPSNIVGNSTTADKLKVPIDINLIGNVEGTTNFDGSKNVDIDVKVKNLKTPREIKLTGELEGSSFFDGSKNIEIFSLVHKLHVPRNIKLTGEVEGNVNFDGSKDVIIDSIVNKLHMPRNIKLIGEVEGNVDFDGSKNVEINSIVNKLHTPRTIELTGDTIGNVQFDGSRNVQINTTTKDDSHSHTNSTISSVDASKINTGILSTERIPNLDASKITSGIIDIERLPAAALERLVEVSNDSERFSLTKQQVQLGDVVKVRDTLKMYKVIDDNRLNNENGYSVFVAGRAAEVPWEGVTGKPSTMPNPYGLYLSLNGVSQPVYTGHGEVRINITPGSIGAQPAGNYSVVGHKHLWNDITDRPSSLKNPYGLIISLNGSSQGSYDGSSNKNINITPNNIGTYTSSEIDNKLNGKANNSHGYHVPNPQSANNKVFLRNDNTWHTITPSDIGAQPAGNYSVTSHTHNKVQDIADGRDITFDYSSNALGINNINWLAVWNGSKLCTIHKNNFLLSSGAVLNEGAEITGSMTSNDSWGIRGLGSDDNGYLELYTKDNGTEPIYFRQYNTSNTISHSITLMDENGNQTFNVVNATKVHNAVWNDYAELFERGEQTEPGDIIALDTSYPTEQYIKADSSSKRVIGVHSDTCGHLIGGEQLQNFEDNFEKFIPVGLAGRVNVKVKGKVELGDYIVPSEEKGIGRAYNKDIDDRDLIIGYLVEADNREDVRRLKMFINKK